jgi:hypothetical protein
MNKIIELPDVSIKVEGSIALIDNLEVFGQALVGYVAGMNKFPKTDEDFGALDAAVKTLKKAETALTEAEAMALSQTASIDTMRKAVAGFKELARSNRLLAEKLVTTEKETRRRDIVNDAAAELAKHVDSLNASIGKPYMPNVSGGFIEAVKGLKTIASITSAAKAELDRCKLQANAIADNIRINVATLRELAKDHVFLFADTAQIVHKLPDDLTALVKARIADHEKVETERLEKERARIREEERVKAEAAERSRVQAEQAAENAEREKMAKAQAEGERVAREFAASQAKPLPVIEPIKPSVAAHREYVNEGPQDVTVPAAVAAPTSKRRPSDDAIIRALSLYFKATPEEVKGWIVFVGGTAL